VPGLKVDLYIHSPMYLHGVCRESFTFFRISSKFFKVFVINDSNQSKNSLSSDDLTQICDPNTCLRYVTYKLPILWLRYSGVHPRFRGEVNLFHLLPRSIMS